MLGSDLLDAIPCAKNTGFEIRHLMQKDCAAILACSGKRQIDKLENEIKKIWWCSVLAHSIVNRVINTAGCSTLQKKKIKILFSRSSVIKRKTFSIGSRSCSKGLHRPFAPYLQVCVQWNCKCLLCKWLCQNIIRIFCVFWFNIMSYIEPATELYWQGKQMTVIVSPSCAYNLKCVGERK